MQLLQHFRFSWYVFFRVKTLFFQKARVETAAFSLPLDCVLFLRAFPDLLHSFLNFPFLRMPFNSASFPLAFFKALNISLKKNKHFATN